MLDVVDPVVVTGVLKGTFLMKCVSVLFKVWGGTPLVWVRRLAKVGRARFRGKGELYVR
jgi:hypothetical protein